LQLLMLLFNCNHFSEISKQMNIVAAPPCGSSAQVYRKRKRRGETPKKFEPNTSGYFLSGARALPLGVLQPKEKPPTAFLALTLQAGSREQQQQAPLTQHTH
jgi:hypothetical protein